MRFVDANVFIYLIVQSPKKDYEIADRILQRIESGEEVAVSLPVVQEVIKWLEYNGLNKEVCNFVIALNSYVSLEKIPPDWNLYVQAIKEMHSKQISFVDSLTLQIMKENKITEIYSSDKDFDRINWVKRIWE
jgi:predicted nucleic acid-binding protein